MVVDKGLYLLYTCLLLLLLKPANSKCQPSFPCKNYTLEYPFTPINRPECGLWPVQGCESSQYGLPMVYMGNLQFPINIINKISGNSMLIEEPGMQDLLNTHNCLAFLPNLYPMNSPLVSFSFLPDLAIFSCYKKADNNKQILDFFNDYNRTECFYFHVYYKIPAPAVGEIPRWCSAYRLPKSDHDSGDLFSLLSSKYVVQWNISKACSKCYRGGGQCLTDNANEFYCKQDKNRVKLILAISVSVTGVLLLLSITYIIWQRKKIMSIRGHLLARITSSYPSSKSDIEGGIFYFGIPVFSCAELEEATNNFDPSQQLGDGGFGTVYHGKLRDGREVAIKRMYEHSFRRVEQFLNEIKILTSLRHPNLVSLYGCTSRRSQELLLVYEYISNGTPADHLHGDRAAEAALSWPVRMNIAIETATALAYLHKSDIIHRDVKTNNILLDSNFSVKVADFGLSRLFPDNVTHISTAPQGTPGYVDPEYYQFYKLTDKSDVYSFGVVLIELISSMPAVDVNRQGLEINLANLAMNRIQRCAFDELIDPSLGYDSDPEVTRMSTSVAELAFRCLQVDKGLRPSMDEVLSFLKDIQGGEDCNCEEIMKEGYTNCNHRKISGFPETDDAVLLKNKEFQASPNAVTDAWDSSASTPASSTG